jgi:tRNA/rRNA methyltransferase
VLCDLGYPEHKRRKTVLMTRRILGRAELTAREVYTLRGILRLIDYHNR